jgi:hypothetical protein
MIDEARTLKFFFGKMWQELCQCIKQRKLIFKAYRGYWIKEWCQQKQRKIEETKITRRTLRIKVIWIWHLYRCVMLAPFQIF